MAIVSEPENLTPASLEKYHSIADRLAHARGLTDDQAHQLSRQGKAGAWIDFGIHSSEVAPYQTAPQFAYDLVTSKTPEAQSILKNVITLFMPSVNPDGGEHVPDWYMKYVGTQYQDSSYPELYHKYAGHDDNRDWFMFNLSETRNLGNVVWHQWYPQLVYDTHQTAAYPARIFLPPFKDPMNPNIPPEVTRGINLLGDSLTQRLDREGKVGAVSRQQYDQWRNGGLRSAPAFHNQVGILSETSHASATPRFEDPAKFPKTFPYQGVSTSELSAFYPSPYKGGRWHLSDSCAYIESTGWAFLRTADEDRENWLYGQYRMAKQAIAAGGDVTYVIPSDQADFATATKMVNVLRQADEQFQLPNAPVHDADVRAGGLRDSYDVIVLPDASYNSMLRGLAPGSHPPQYTGGMTQAGIDNLRAFVQQGGTLITVNEAAQLPIRAFADFPVSYVTAGVPSTSYYSQGSILATVVDPRTPLTSGLPESLDAYSDGSPAFAVKAGASGVTTPVKYPASNLLRSGWLLGENIIAGQTAVAGVKYGDGQVTLLGVSVQHRAQAHGTYKLLFNSLFLGAEK